MRGSVICFDKFRYRTQTGRAVRLLNGPKWGLLSRKSGRAVIFNIIIFFLTKKGILRPHFNLLFPQDKILTPQYIF